MAGDVYSNQSEIDALLNAIAAENQTQIKSSGGDKVKSRDPLQSSRKETSTFIEQAKEDFEKSRAAVKIDQSEKKYALTKCAICEKWFTFPMDNYDGFQKPSRHFKKGGVICEGEKEFVVPLAILDGESVGLSNQEEYLLCVIKLLKENHGDLGKVFQKLFSGGRVA